MKYIDKKIAGQGQTVYTFFLGKQELTLLSELLSKHYLAVRGITEASTTGSRAQQMTKTINNVLREDELAIKKNN